MKFGPETNEAAKRCAASRPLQFPTRTNPGRARDRLLRAHYISESKRGQVLPMHNCIRTTPMSQIAQQMIAPTFVEDGSVSETYVNGPMSVNVIGQVATIVFTIVRNDFDQAMQGKQVTKMNARPACRLAMPVQTLLQFRELLKQIIVEPDLPGAMISGSNLKQ
jgi:hypothetical protein